MPQRNVATNFTFEQQRLEINLLAQDFWTQKGTVDTAASTYLKHDGTNNFTGATLAVPNAFTINSNSGNGTVTISGNLDVTGTTTTVSSANLEVTDKNILISKGSTTDAQADGAGITIDSDTDITWNFVDANDAWVSSIGVEATTHLKAARGQFTGATTPTTGSGVEINAPDANTGQIIAYNRGGTPTYNELRVKGTSVGVYTGSTNALVGTFNSTGLTMESGKTITGVLATAAQTNITSVGTLSSLGIGVAPSSGEGSELAVKGSDGATNVALIPNADTESSYISFYNAAYDSQQGYIKYNNNDNSLQFRVNLQPRLHISSSGQILINRVAQHASSSERLSVNGMTSIQFDSPDSAGLYIFNEDTTTANDQVQPFIFCHDGSGIRSGLGVQRSNGQTVLNGQFGLSIRTGSSGVGGTERLSITNTGLVSIKSTTYSALDITTTEDGNNGPEIQLIHNSASPAADDCVGQIRFKANDSAGNSDLMGRIETILDSPTSGAESAHINFATRGLGSFNTIFRLNARGSASAPSYTTDDMNGIILDTYNTGNPYPRYFNFIAKSAGNTDSNIGFWTEEVGGSPTEKLRISSDGRLLIGTQRTFGAQSYYDDLTINNSNTADGAAGSTGITLLSGNNTWSAILFGDSDDDDVGSIKYSHIGNYLRFTTNGSTRMELNSDGDMIPEVDNTQDLGSSSKRWANVYTGDMHLNNMNSGGNEVDGSEGHWTMQEGADDLFLINRNTGKKYKFNLTEVS